MYQKLILISMNPKNIIFLGTIFCFIFLSLVSCGGDGNVNESSSSKQDDSINYNIAEDFYGVYEGEQPSYSMKNKFGDDFIVDGEPLIVPAMNHKFKVEGNLKISLQQTSVEDNERYYYDGKYKIENVKNDTIYMFCSFWEDGGSKPEFKLRINMNTHKGICIRENEPIFEVSKID